MISFNEAFLVSPIFLNEIVKLWDFGYVVWNWFYFLDRNPFFVCEIVVVKNSRVKSLK